MPRRSPRFVLVMSAVLALLLVAAAVVLRWGSSNLTPKMSPPQVAVAEKPPPTATLSPAPDDVGAADDAFAPSAPPMAPSDEPLADAEDWDGSWESVDLEAIRAALPDNLYWKMAAPTTDPEVLRQREEERARWNAEYGKVLSNTATDEEIDAYYAERQKVSEDYLEFIVYLMTNYGYQIPKRDVAAFKLAGEMHLARLEEIPRQIAEAHARREAHEKARQAWLADQKAFEGELAPGTDAPPDQR
jgi:hypothetical protein